jgi:shikimate dehydrogenase
MKTFGLIGYPLTHSFSKKFFTQKFSHENIDAQYLNFEIESIDKFPNIIIENPNLQGLNVTIPYKESIIPFLDSLDTNAQKIGAVNCVVFKNKKLIGYNTDYLGFIDMLKPLLKSVHKKALVFGSGGASKAIQYALSLLNIDFQVISRNGKFKYESIDEKMYHESLLWINCTPIGMYPNIDESLPLRYDLVTNQHLVVDLIYNPETTLFLQKAMDKGATCINGYKMLENQAIYAWNLWNN